MAVVINTSPSSLTEEVGVVLLEQELNWAEPAEDGPAVLSNILDVLAGWFLARSAVGWGESGVYQNLIFITNYLSW